MLNGIEKGAFHKLFNRSGYVLDFSTNEFDVFTAESIGVPLCEKYKMSKGKSLLAYCEEATDEEIIKLFSDLLQYYELNCMDGWGEEKNKPLYERCKALVEREKGNIIIETPAIVCVNRNYIIDISTRAIRDVENGEYDSAITKSRTLLEEVFCHAIEAKGETPSDSGDIGRLYNQVKTLYNMHQDRDVDRRINGLLSGLEKILTAIGQMRNESSDSHGVGDRRINLKEHHTRLFVNAAMTMADFILSVEKNSEDA